MSGKNIVWRGSTELEVVKQNSLTAMRHHTDEQIKKFKDLNTEILISIDHNQYNHKAVISKNTKEALSKDFS